MHDRLHKIVTLFADDETAGCTVLREYATWGFAGEGAPRDVEITAEQRLALYGAAHQCSAALLAQAREERDAALARLAEIEAQINAAAADGAAR